MDPSTIDTYTRYSPNYRGHCQHRLKVIPVSEEKGYGDRNRFTALARSSSEVLFYGRIFMKDFQSV